VAGVDQGAWSAPAPLDLTHDITGFSCGDPALDGWLKTTALRAEGRTARTYVVCDGKSVVGYYCLATGSVDRSGAPGRIRRNAPDPIPIVVIGRLAVTDTHQGRGVGGGMLRDAFRRSVQVAEVAGCAAILVHAIDEDAVAFYERFGFAVFPSGTRTLFLPIETLRGAL